MNTWLPTHICPFRIPLTPLKRRESEFSHHSTISLSQGSDTTHTPLLPQDPSKKTSRSRFRALKQRLPEGWRFGATLAVALGSLVLVVNVTVLGLLIQRNSSHSAIVPISTGSCASLKHTSLFVHLAINIASSLLLSGSNFCMQCISAPTRKDIDAAHVRGRWLDIAVPSVRNIRVLGRTRLLLWLFIGLSSIPLHLLYNADGTLETKNHTFGTYQAPLLASIQANASQFQRLDNRDCITAYTQRILADRSNVILVASNTPQDDAFAARFNNRCQNPNADIIQPATEVKYYEFPTNCSTLYRDIRDNASRWAVSGFNIDHCLSQTPESQCSFNAAISLLVVVIVFNVFKIVAMVYTLSALQDKPLITIGDAVESFLVRRDSSTTGKHLLTAEKVRDGDILSTKNSESLEDPLRSNNMQLRWWRSASKARWSVALIICIITIVSLLIFAIYNVKLAGIDTIQEVLELGLGTIDPRTLIHSWAIPTTGDGATILSILVANSPQLILSFIYLIFNTLFTTMSLAVEWSNYSRQSRTLRVSHRKGEQRSTYFLQIPYRLGIPVMIFSMVLHWLISQSIFLAKIDDNDIELDRISTCGYSVVGMIATLIAGVILAVFAIILGSRKLPPGMPLVGSCSLAIAAACHAPDGTSELRPLKWGPLSLEERESHEKIGRHGFYNP
ncbi:hypothetical protein DL96DRAFT_1539440 [Flagelloscypha sp. PMI_526]|nr:hypothetical protein DL96DRAFT_1539440 [Flagelloscypha sp. PMI_526]